MPRPDVNACGIVEGSARRTMTSPVNVDDRAMSSATRYQGADPSTFTFTAVSTENG